MQKPTFWWFTSSSLYMRIYESPFIRTEDKDMTDRRSYIRILGSYKT